MNLHQPASALVVRAGVVDLSDVPLALFLVDAVNNDARRRRRDADADATADEAATEENRKSIRHLVTGQQCF